MPETNNSYGPKKLNFIRGLERCHRIFDETSLSFCARKCELKDLLMLRNAVDWAFLI
jgi:hypothetical protein